MVEFKEITLRHWWIDTVIILVVLAGLVGATIYYGVNLEVYPTGKQLVLNEQFEDENLAIKLIQDENYYYVNLTEEKLMAYTGYNSTHYLPANKDIYTFIEAENTEGGRYLEITYNIVGIVNNGIYIGLTPSIENYTAMPYNKKAVWLYIHQGTDTVMIDVYQATVYGMYSEYKTKAVIYYTEQLKKSDKEGIEVKKPPPTPMTEIKFDAIYRVLINPDTETFTPSNTIKPRYLANFTIKYVFNYDYPDYSYIAVKYRDARTGEYRYAILPMVMETYEKPNYVYTILYMRTGKAQIQSEADAFTVIGTWKFDNLQIYSGNVAVSRTSMALTILIILGFLLLVGMITKDMILHSGWNSTDAFLVSVGAMLIVIGIIGYLIPAVVLSPSTLVLTVSTFAVFVIWVAFQTGKIEFKGQIDEWLAEHGDALFFGLLVLTIIQYIFGIFP